MMYLLSAKKTEELLHDQLTNYREGIYSPEQAAKLLQDKFLDQQYYFGTERALCYLNKLHVESV